MKLVMGVLFAAILFAIFSHGELAAQNSNDLLELSFV